MTASPPPTPQSAPEPNILGNFASIVGLLGTALFFTGWIYRWSYFSNFKLNISTLDLSVESFLIVPLQVFFPDGWTTLKSAIALLLTGLAIYHILWLFDIVTTKVYATVNNWIIARLSSSRPVTRNPWLDRPLMSWDQFKNKKMSSIRLLRSLINQIIIVSLVLLVLFWFASNQGTADARLDAGEKSTLPAVILIFQQKNIALGRKLDKVFEKPDIKDYKFIGDKGLFNDLLNKEDTDTLKPRVWRLLLERGNWIYLFPALTTEQQKDPKARPPVIAIQQSQSGDQFLIISPEPSKQSK